jgi:hypothetical protein
VRQICRLKLDAEVAAARQLSYAVDDLVSAFEERQKPAQPMVAREVTCLLCGREWPPGNPVKCQCGGYWLTS